MKQNYNSMKVFIHGYRKKSYLILKKEIII